MKSNSSLMSRLGLYTAILALIAFLVPVVALLLGATGAVQMNTADDIKSLLTNAVIVGIIAFALAVVATLLTLPGLFSEPRQGVAALIGSVLLLLLSAGFLFGMVLPRVSAVQNLQDKTIPFAQTMNANCKAPLNAIKEDLTNIRNFADSTKASDAGYAGGVGTYVGTLRRDQALLSDSLYTLQHTTVPDAKYQTLLDECVKSLKGYQALLTAPQAIPVPPTVAPLLAPIAPLLGANAVVATDGSVTSVDALGLFTASVAVAGSGKAPTGTAQTIVSQAMTTVINTTNDTLTKAGDQLVQDIKDGLNNNLSPFKVNVPVG